MKFSSTFSVEALHVNIWEPLFIEGCINFLERGPKLFYYTVLERISYFWCVRACGEVYEIYILMLWKTIYNKFRDSFIAELEWYNGFGKGWNSHQHFLSRRCVWIFENHYLSRLHKFPYETLPKTVLLPSLRISYIPLVCAGNVRKFMKTMNVMKNYNKFRWQFYCG